MAPGWMGGSSCFLDHSPKMEIRIWASAGALASTQNKSEMPEQGPFLTCPFLFFFFFFLALTLDTLYCLFPQYSFTYPPTKHSFRGYLLSDCITQATGSKVPGVNVFIYSCVLA